MTLADIAPLSKPIWIGVAAVLGLVFGSFITALSYRWPRGQSVATGRSKCPACGATLTARDLVPVLSWAANAGKCRTCEAGVSWRYPAIEAATAAVFAVIVWRQDDLAALALLLAMAVLMVALAVIDLESARLPLPALGVLAILCLTWHWRQDPDSLREGVLAALGAVALGLSVGATSRAIKGMALIGAGDTYSLALGALAFPWDRFVIFLGLAGLFGLGVAALWRLTRHTGWSFPFAPAVFLAFGAVALWPETLAGFVASLQ